jgi:hypothetical protein
MNEAGAKRTWYSSILYRSALEARWRLFYWEMQPAERILKAYRTARESKLTPGRDGHNELIKQSYFPPD